MASSKIKLNSAMRFMVLITLALIATPFIGGIRTLSVHGVNFSTSSSSVTSPLGFEGLNQTQSCSPTCNPPDVQVAAGPNHVMEMVNLALSIYSKSGSLLQVQSLSQFYHTRSDFLSDPKLLFDNSTGRWFASIEDVTTNSAVIAVSTTNDPTSGWRTTTISCGCSTLIDQPIIGISDDKFVASVNISNQAKWWVFNKADLVQGAKSPRFQVFGPFATLFSVHPVQTLSPTTTQYMVTSGVNASSTSPSNALQLFSITGVPGVSTVAMTNVSLTVNPGITQPLATSVNTGDYRVQSTVWFQSRLWLALNTSCRTSPTTTVSCIRFFQIDTGANPVTVRQDIQYFASGQDFYYPAISVDNLGNLAAIYGYGTPNRVPPSLAITGQSIADPSGSLISAQTIKPGVSSSILNERFGDYFGAGLDPADPKTVWVAGEYYKAPLVAACSGDPNRVPQDHCWGTFIADMRVQFTINNTSTFNGVIVKTLGTFSITLSPASGLLTGSFPVAATNSSTGASIFSKTYVVTNLTLAKSSSSYMAKFLLNIAINSCPPCNLSSDITFTMTPGSSANSSVAVTRNVDVNGDGVVDSADLSYVQTRFGCTIGNLCYDPKADLDADGTVDIIDVAYEANYQNAPNFI